jgi:putative ABC transport system permease protein
VIHPKYIPLTLKHVIRHSITSLLTVAGVATSMFLFVAIEAMQKGVTETTLETAADTTLVVYREDRFCPFTSRLPEYYLSTIRKLEHVDSVTPIKVVVNNCRASLDVVTFRGVPRDQFVEEYATSFVLASGSLQDWKRRTDASLIGETLAKRRGLKIGDRFDAAGVTSYVAGVLRSDEPQDQNVAYVHLDFLQQATDRKLGVVTQFNVKVDDPGQLDSVAGAIDELFATSEQPTSTRSEKAFIAHVAGDMIELVGYTRYLGRGCLIAVLFLVGNAVVLAIQNRIKEHAILQTLGYGSGLIARLIIAEGAVLGLIGGLIGSGVAIGLLHYSQVSLSVDGLSIPIVADQGLVLQGLAASVLLGAMAGLVPAWRASRREITECFRAV